MPWRLGWGCFLKGEGGSEYIYKEIENLWKPSFIQQEPPYMQSWKLEIQKLSITNQTLAMVLDLLSFMSKDGVLL